MISRIEGITINIIEGDIKMSKNKKPKKGELKLIEIIYLQLEKSQNFEKLNIGSFDDGSSSWIDCYHTSSPDSDGKRYCNHLSFNGEGTVLEDVQVWVEQMSWDDDKCKQLR